eukprot:12397869-Ditylum_brightwellii.AAC.1
MAYNKWVWSDGSDWDFFVWNDGEPNNSNRYEDALEVKSKGNSLVWNDIAGQRAYKYSVMKFQLPRDDLCFQITGNDESINGYYQRSLWYYIETQNKS